MKEYVEDVIDQLKKAVEHHAACGCECSGTGRVRKDPELGWSSPLAFCPFCACGQLLLIGEFCKRQLGWKF